MRERVSVLKANRLSKSEDRKIGKYRFRISVFGLLSDFGLRPSFGFRSSAFFRISVFGLLSDFGLRVSAFEDYCNGLISHES